MMHMGAYHVRASPLKLDFNEEKIEKNILENFIICPLNLPYSVALPRDGMSGSGPPLLGADHSSDLCKTVEKFLLI